MNTKYLKIVLLLLPLLFVGALFFLPDKDIETEGNIPKDVVEYAKEIFGNTGNIHIVEDRGTIIKVKWTDPATAPPGDPELEVYHVLSNPYAESKKKTDQIMHAIIIRNLETSSVTVTSVVDTSSFDFNPKTAICGTTGAHTVWKPDCLPEDPSEDGGVITWTGGSWIIAANNQRVFREVHSSQAHATGNSTVTTAVVSSDHDDPPSEENTVYSNEKCTPPYYGFSFGAVDDNNWYSAYPEDGTADYYQPSSYDNQDFYFEIEISTDQGEGVTLSNAVLTFPTTWNVDSCVDGGGASTASCSVNDGTPDTVTLNSVGTLDGNPDGWIWHMVVDLPSDPDGEPFGLVYISDWGTVDGNDTLCDTSDEFGFVEFPIYVGVEKVVQKHYRWRYDDGGE